MRPATVPGRRAPFSPAPPGTVAIIHFNLKFYDR
jgi:hypothetical protein